jgi:hypothetical protein
MCNGEGKTPEHYGLSPMQKKILDAIVQRPRSTAELADYVYADREDGGPDNAAGCVWGQIHNINLRVRPFGFQLRAKTSSGGAPYHVERIA